MRSTFVRLHESVREVLGEAAYMAANSGLAAAPCVALFEPTARPNLSLPRMVPEPICIVAGRPPHLRERVIRVVSGITWSDVIEQAEFLELAGVLRALKLDGRYLFTPDVRS